MVSYNNSLYIGTQEPSGAEVYRYDGGTTWTKVSQSTAGTIASGGTASIEGVASLAVYNGSLYAGTYDSGSAGEVYRYDGGTSWVRVNDAGGTLDQGTGTTNIQSVASLTVYNGQLYTGTYNPGAAEVYRYGGGKTWTRISQSTAGTIASGGTAAIDYIGLTTIYNNKIIFGTQKTNAAEVYAFSSIEGQSYNLTFQASSNNASGTSILQNEATISFMAEQQGINNSSFGNTGSFLFSHGINTTTGAYDLAEDYPTRDDSLKAGDIVSIDPSEQTFVKKSTGQSSDYIVGVYSTRPALRLSQQDSTINGARAVPIALAGRVPVKVSAENGSILPGDPITISPTQPGVGVKATKNGRIIGMSMGSFSGGGIGEVTIFLNPSYYDLPAGDVIQSAGADFATLNVSGETHLSNLTVRGDLNVFGMTTLTSLKVNGDTEVVQLTVNGKIITKGEAPKPEVIIPDNYIVTPANPAIDTITELSGTDVAGKLSLKTKLTTLPETKVRIKFNKPYTNTPVVNITPVGKEAAKVVAYVESATNDEVIITFVSPLANNQTYEFNYQIIQAVQVAQN